MTIMPRDKNSNPIPVLSFKETDGAHQVNITSSSNRNTTAFNSECYVITIVATVNCFIEQGMDNTVTSSTSRHYIPSGIPFDIEIGGGKVDHRPYLAVIRAGSTDGTLYISERR